MITKPTWENKPQEQFTKKAELSTTAKQTVETLKTNPSIISENWVLSINWLADLLGMQKELVKLPNWKEISTLVWKPEQLEDIYTIISKSPQKSKLGVKDLVTIDWACPAWLLATISHSLHPVSTAATYPQWWPDEKLPLNWFSVEWEWIGDDLKFEKQEDEDKTTIIFSLDAPSIDIKKTLNSLVAPEVTNWKPVHISGRWPVSIATALAEAYAHKVPYVACFQPGVGNVVSITHSDTNLWEIIK